MNHKVLEKRLPQLSLVLPLSSTIKDAEAAASKMISEVLGIEYFEIMDVRIIEEGSISTPVGLREGKRYAIVFLQNEGEIVFVHPNFGEHYDKRFACWKP